MKNLFLVLLLSGFIGVFNSCEKDDLPLDDAQLITEIATSADKQSISPQEVPESITRYVEENYAPVVVEAAALVPRYGYEIILDDDLELYFSLDRGNRCLGDGTRGHHPHRLRRCIKGDPIEVADLPQAIIDFVADEVPDATIEHARVKTTGKYVIALSNGAILLFDENGVFIKRCGQYHPHHGHQHHGVAVDVADLPVVIADYLADHYPGEEVDRAILRDNGNYYLRLGNGVRLVFDADGNILYDSGN